MSDGSVQQSDCKHHQPAHPCLALPAFPVTQRSAGLCCGSVTTSSDGSEVEWNCAPFLPLKLSHRWRGRISVQGTCLERAVWMGLITPNGHHLIGKEDQLALHPGENEASVAALCKRARRCSNVLMRCSPQSRGSQGRNVCILSTVQTQVWASPMDWRKRVIAVL